MFHAESMKAGMSSYFANKKRINDASELSTNPVSVVARLTATKIRIRAYQIPQACPADRSAFRYKQNVAFVAFLF